MDNFNPYVQRLRYFCIKTLSKSLKVALHLYVFGIVIIYAKKLLLLLFLPVNFLPLCVIRSWLSCSGALYMKVVIEEH